MKTALIRFYSSLIFLYFSDMTLLMAVMWLSYELTQSALFLSAMLFLSAILPLLLRQLKFKLNLLGLTLSQLMKLRIIIYLSFIILCYFIGTSVFSLTLFSLFTGLLSVTILSSYESKNTQFVLAGEIDKSLAARAIQTVIQVGAFIGAMLGSFILEHWGFELTIYIIALLDISICLLLLFIEPKPSELPSSQINTEKSSISHQRLIYLFCILLGFVALHISTFNLTVPIIFQQIHQWDVTDFGLASGFAGVGAFLAAFIPFPKRYFALLFGGLVVVDLLFTFNQMKIWIAPLCLIIGYCMNSIRINVREALIECSHNPQQAVAISGLSATFYMLFQSFGTLSLGILLGILPQTIAVQLLLPFIALIIISVAFYTKKDKK